MEDKKYGDLIQLKHDVIMDDVVMGGMSPEDANQMSLENNRL